MDPYNLAICFGPTLVPIPAERDQVQHQNMVNELIKNFIIFHEDIFPNDSQGTVYEKYISSEPEFVREFDNEEKSLFEDETDNEPELTDEGNTIFNFVHVLKSNHYSVLVLKLEFSFFFFLVIMYLIFRLCFKTKG